MGFSSAILACCAGWAWLSPAFRYGEGHAERPIVLFVALWLAAGVGLVVLSWALVQTLDRSAQLPWKAALVMGLLSRLVLLPTPLIQEDDPYRYVLDGQTLLAGGDPYELSPGEIGESFAHPLTPQLRDSAQARKVLGRVSNPELRTVYPPAAQAAFAAGAWLGGWHWQGQRWVFLAADLGVLALLLLLLKLLSLPPQWSLLWACNPLVLKEVANSAHVDVLAAFFLLASLLAAALYAQRPHWAWAAAGGCALGLSVLSKLYAAFLLPAFFIWMLRARSPSSPPRPKKARLWPGLIFLGVFLLVTFPGLALVLQAADSGLLAYASRWRINDGAFALLATLTDQFGLPSAAPRLLAGLAALAVALLVPWRGGAFGLGRLVSDMQLVLLLWFLLLPAAYPWYALPMLALLPLCPAGRTPRAALILSMLAGLYYLHFWVQYNGLSPHWSSMFAVIQHGAIWLALLLPGRKNDPPLQ